jgi:hypothetical protein
MLSYFFKAKINMPITSYLRGNSSKSRIFSKGGIKGESNTLEDIAVG